MPGIESSWLGLGNCWYSTLVMSFLRRASLARLSRSCATSSWTRAGRMLAAQAGDRSRGGRLDLVGFVLR